MEWLHARGTLKLGPRPLIMGILNVTPDSFHDGGRYFSAEAAVAQGLQLAEAGADIIDIGGESTRPGADPVEPDEELRRVIPVVQALSEKLTIPLSIDTTKARVAREALAAGAAIINDVSGGEWDSELWPAVREAQAGYVLMHCQGTPATMQKNPSYRNVVEEVATYLQQRLEVVREAGLEMDRIACDPGIGFGKTAQHNLQLIDGLDALKKLSRPLLIGLSQKSFLNKIGSGKNTATHTLLMQVWASARGAHIWRTHDVAAARIAAEGVEALRSTSCH